MRHALARAEPPPLPPSDGDRGQTPGAPAPPGPDVHHHLLRSRDETKIKLVALAIAFVLHCVVLMLNFPEFKQVLTPRPSPNVIVVKRYVPPPPKVERRTVSPKKVTRKLPVPDPTPDEPEPIREPEPEIVPEPYPPDVEFLIGVPEAPPVPKGPAGPLIAGVGEVTTPSLIPESKVQPNYPEIGRVARLEANVILKAVIHADGTVGEIEVLRCTQSKMGFEDAAVTAVQQWRYEPATLNGRPVDVYFTVVVDFTLL